MIPYRMMAIVLLATVLVYTGMSFAFFDMPVSLEEAQACGFTSADFTPAGELSYAPVEAWRISFVRTGDYWSALSIGLAAAFLAFALLNVRRLGGAVVSGAAVGSSMLVLGAVCLSCLAPVLSIVGLGMAAGFLAGVPKWLMALNTLLVTAWGTLFLSRRLSACPVMPAAGALPR